MCGISGSIGTDSPSATHIDAQLRLLDHRGPDARGHFAIGGGTVGQTRLAIIDLETGDPPILNEDGTIGVALNGEIYNFGELREQLRAHGHVFSTSGDTEPIAHLAEENDACSIAQRLDGMFAFAIWDARRKRLILGRDPVGKKPLYYWSSPGAFVFGSEIKAVLAHPAVRREPDESAISAYLSFGYVPTPRTFYRGICSLPPAHVLTVGLGENPLIQRYWSPPVRRSPSAGSRPSMKMAAGQVRSRLEKAVRKRLVADVPLGAFLSGGLDSSLIVALMAGMVDRPVQTFTIGFDDADGFDEREYARVVADRYATDHHEFVVAPNAVDLIERLVWHHDQPFGDSSAVPTFLLNELTRKHVTVALSGDGGDELFAGYERFSAATAIGHYGSVPPLLRQNARRIVDRLPRTALRGRVGSLQRFVGSAEMGMPDAYINWLSFFSEATRDEALPGSSSWAIDDFRSTWAASDGAHPLDRLLDVNLRTYLVDDLLVKADRMSMAHGLEVRSPFLDTDLLTYALGLPPSMKARGFSRKRVLKAAAGDLLPKEITGRRKRGFGVPLDRWFRDDLQSYVEDRLGSQQSRVRAYVEPVVIDRLLHEHRSGTRDHGQPLWLLLTLEIFLRAEGW